MSSSSASSSGTIKRDAPVARPANTKWKDWLGVLPFFIFVLLFIVLPSVRLFVGAMQNKQGAFTFQNFIDLSRPDILDAYWISIKISMASALIGGVIGFFMAYAVTLGGLPRWVRTALTTFSGVASNFAGVPLAFAFIATLGRTGMMTILLSTVFGINLYETGFNLYSFWGLTLTYVYFQFPLMVLVITPSLDGLRKEWREACENLGGNTTHYWTRIGIPVLLPSLLASLILLFGNAFGAYATALSLTGGFLNLVTLLIGSQIKGDVLLNIGLGYALAVGMVIIMIITMTIYYLLRRRSERWLRI